MKNKRQISDNIQHAMNHLRMGSLRSEEFGDSMQRLWIAVILQAMLDLMNTSDKIREDAEEFFAGENLEAICDNVGLDYIAIIKRATLLLRG